MAAEVIHLNVRKPAAKVFLILLLLAATVWSYFALCWYLGNTLAEYFNMDDNSLRMAGIAESLAPNDPLTHWRLGDVSQQKLPPDQIAQAIKEYEKAVSLSPNDYRFWTSLGTALEQADEDTRSELALRHAVALAPSYAYPHWYLGNLLLRSNRYDEAFGELRRATEADAGLRPQLFNIAWQIYGQNVELLKKAVGDAPGVRAEFSLYLLSQKRYDEGIQLWNSLTEPDKSANKSTGESLVSALLGVQRFHNAMQVWNDIAPGLTSRAQVGEIVDGGFEEDIIQGNQMAFLWQVQPAPQTQIGIDPATAHNGSRSLRLLFQVRGKLDSIGVSELVPVAAGTQYDLDYYFKTEKLQSGGTPLVQISDAGDGSVLVSSAPAASGDNDWQPVSLSFKTGLKTQAVVVKIVRGSCGDTQVCPIFGAIWYDDFSVKRRG